MLQYFLNLSCFFQFFIIVGFLFTLKQILDFLFFLKRIYKPKVNVLNRYGSGSYAFITGGSDGIGKAFAFDLGSQGFNLILVARNKEKLEGVKNEILLKNPKILIKILIFDFKNSSNIELFKDIYSEIKGLDISLLVNNVGIDHVDAFIKAPPEILKNLININCFPVFFLTHHILPNMLKRTSKSAIINISSMSAVRPVPYFCAYGSTKSFIDYFTKAMEREYPSIDWISVRPNFVDTNINNHLRNFQTVNPEGVVQGVLSDLGNYVESFGHWKHEIINSVIRNVPFSLIKPIYFKVMLPEIMAHHDKHREELENKNK